MSIKITIEDSTQEFSQISNADAFIGLSVTEKLSEKGPGLEFKTIICGSFSDKTIAMTLDALVEDLSTKLLNEMSSAGKKSYKENKIKQFMDKLLEGKKG